ncbi:AP-4 complex subunit epsilon-1, partial [Haplosporangium sp. Z 11]
MSTSTMKENMLRLIHGEMMGEDVQFGAIYALKLAQSGQTVAEKRAGYLACYLLLQEGNELNIIESVRKRALIALKNFYTRQPDLVVPYLDQIKGSLYDPEPSVMSAALGLFATVVQDRAGQMKDMVPVLIKILQQVVDNKLPKGYSYHGMAAPWIQIRCLLIMARLGQDDL